MSINEITLHFLAIIHTHVITKLHDFLSSVEHEDFFFVHTMESQMGSNVVWFPMFFKILFQRITMHAGLE